MRILKKSLAVLLAALLLVSVGAVAAFAEGESELVASDYYVVGDTALTGGTEAWKTTDEEALQMDMDANGVLIAEAENVPAGSYEFKVIYKNEGNITWIPDGMGNNNKVEVAADDSKVVITYDPKTDTAAKAEVFDPTNETGPSTPEDTVDPPAEDDGVIAEFEYDNTDKTAKEDVTEYVSKDNEYYYVPTRGEGVLFGSVTGDRSALKHMEWTDNIYSDTEGNVLGIQPVFAASDKNNWSANAFVEMQFSTKGYSDLTIDFDLGASKKGPANYKVVASNDDETQELGTIKLEKNKTMYSFTADLSEKFDNSVVDIQVLLTDTKSVGGADLSENPAGGEIAINNIALSGVKIEEETTETVSETDATETVSDETTKPSGTAEETETVTETVADETTKPSGSFEETETVTETVTESDTTSDVPVESSETAETSTEFLTSAPSDTNPETTVPVTNPDETDAPVALENELVLTVVSNIFPSYSTVYNTQRDSELTVTFKLDSKTLAVVNCEGEMTYNSKYLELVSFEIPKLGNTVINTELADRVAFNSTDISAPAVFTGDQFITAKFKIVGTGNTAVNLQVSELNAADGDVDVALITDGAAVRSFYVLSETSEPTPAPTEPTTPTEKTVKLNATKKTLAAGKTFQIKVTNNKKAPTSYTSSKKSIAVVSKKGKVTALKKGKATVTVKVDGKKLKLKVTVKNDPTAKIKKKNVSAKKTYTVSKGKFITVKIGRKAKSIKNKYSTTSSKIAKVTSKKTATTVKIKGLKKGKATIKITVNKSKVFKIKIKVV